MTSGKKPPVPQTGSQFLIADAGPIASTITWMTGREVVHCPVVVSTSCAFRSIRASHVCPKTLIVDKC